jgi:uncharacterized protein (DUF1810 family)
MGLERFIDAQADLYPRVVEELRRGAKRSHWMWFIFPQIAGLGHSEMARRFAIAGLREAAAFLAHPILGPRLRECVQILNQLEGRTAAQIFGYPDDLKLRSSLTLFAEATSDNGVFLDCLDKYYQGESDPETRKRL